MAQLIDTPPAIRRPRFSPKLALGVVGLVLIEGLLLLGGVFAAEPAPRPCTAAMADASAILRHGDAGADLRSVVAAWSVPVHAPACGKAGA